MAVTLEGLLAQGNVAFVMTEVQEGIIGDLAPWPDLAAAARKVGLVENAARLAQAAREYGSPVIHCTAETLPGHFGTNTNSRLFGNARKRADARAQDPRYVEPPAAVWRDGDILLPRFHGTSAMTGGPLDSVLRNEAITTLVVSGVSLCFGLLNLTFDAANRAYQVILARDAAAGFPEPYANEVVANTLSMLATVASTDAILSAWTPARAG